MAEQSHTTNPTDAALLDAETDVIALYAALDKMPTDTREEEEALEPLRDRANDLEEFVRVEPSETLTGAAVKLRRLLDPEIGMVAGERKSDMPALRDILAFMERAQGVPASDVIKSGVFDLDDLITQSECCSTTIGKLTDYVEAGHTKQSLYSVNTDLGSALIKMRRIFNDLHVAVRGAS